MKEFKLKTFLQLIYLSVIFFNQNVYAQEPQDSLKSYTVDEMVFSASRRLQDPFTVGKSVIVIDQEQLAKYVYYSVGEVLSEVSGLHLIGSYQNFGANQRLFLRSGNSYHVVVMIDGVRISDPSSVDNGIDLSELSLNNIERIEIIKGAHSTLYGSSAISGVINIITKKNNLNRYNVKASLSGGSFGKNTFAWHNDIFLNLNHKSGLYLILGLNQMGSDGLDATMDTITNPAVYKNRDADAHRSLNYSAKMGWRKKKTDISVFYRKINQFSELDKSAFIDDDNRFIEFERNLFSWNAVYDFSEKIKMTYQGSFSDMKRVDTDDSSVVDASGNYDHQYVNSEFTGIYQDHELNLNIDMKKLALVTGFNFNQERMNNYNYIYSNHPIFGLYESTYDLDTLDLNSNTKSFFLHTDINGTVISSKLSGLNIGFGTRYSNHSLFGGFFTWGVNPSLKITNSTLLFYSLSTGFNAPSLYRLYSPDRGWGAVTTRGNSNLKPEESLSNEIGIKHRFDNNDHFTIAFFNNRIKDIIEYVYLWDKNIGVDTLGNDWARNDYRGDTYINLAEQRIYGVEFFIMKTLSPALKINGNFTYMYGVSPISATGIDTLKTGGNHVQLFEGGQFVSSEIIEKTGLVRRPDAIVNLGLEWLSFKKMSVIWNTRFVGMRYDAYYNQSLGPYGAMDNRLIKAYSLTNLLFLYRPLKNLNISVKVENLFNTEYMEIYGFSTRPRGFYLKLDYILSK